MLPSYYKSLMKNSDKLVTESKQQRDLVEQVFNEALRPQPQRLQPTKTKTRPESNVKVIGTQDLTLDLQGPPKASLPAVNMSDMGVATSAETSRRLSGVRVSPEMTAMAGRINVKSLATEPAPSSSRSDTTQLHTLGDEPEPTTLPATIDTVPSVVGKDIGAHKAPKWMKVSDLPGYNSAAIRTLGKGVFDHFNDEDLGNIKVVARLHGGDGPHSEEDMLAIGGWLKNHTEEGQPMEMDFGGGATPTIPGYKAAAKRYTSKNVSAMAVKDQFGHYVYAWPRHLDKNDTSPKPDSSAIGSQKSLDVKEGANYKLLGEASDIKIPPKTKDEGPALKIGSVSSAPVSSELRADIDSYRSGTYGTGHADAAHKIITNAGFTRSKPHEKMAHKQNPSMAHSLRAYIDHSSGNLLSLELPSADNPDGTVRFSGSCDTCGTIDKGHSNHRPSFYFTGKFRDLHNVMNKSDEFKWSDDRIDASLRRGTFVEPGSGGTDSGGPEKRLKGPLGEAVKAIRIIRG